MMIVRETEKYVHYYRQLTKSFWSSQGNENARGGTTRRKIMGTPPTPDFLSPEARVHVVASAMISFRESIKRE